MAESDSWVLSFSFSVIIKPGKVSSSRKMHKNIESLKSERIWLRTASAWLVRVICLESNILKSFHFLPKNTQNIVSQIKARQIWKSWSSMSSRLENIWEWIKYENFALLGSQSYRRICSYDSFCTLAEQL